jgi:hypothetical protein
MSDPNLEDIDTVNASLRHAQAVIELLCIHASDANHTHDIWGTGLAADICDAVDDLIGRGREAFARIEKRRMAAL